MKKSEKHQLKKIIKNHVIQNYREYGIISILFVIGIFLGVLFINTAKEAQTAEIHTYLTQFIEKIKNTENIENWEILKSSLWDDLVLTITIWFFGTTVIGIPVVFGIIVYKGFCLGYTISACISMMGFSKGIVFVLITLVVQNIIFIPALIALAVSGFKLYKSIIKDRRKENIKLEIIRHTIFSAIMLIVLCVASVLEITISTNLLKICIDYF